MSLQPSLMPYRPWPVPPPDLPVRGPSDPGEPERVLRAHLRAKTSQGVELAGTTQNGGAVTVEIEVIRAAVVRVRLTADELDASDRVTLAREQARESVPPQVDVSPGSIVVDGQGLIARISLDPFHLAFRDATGRLLLEQNATERDVSGFLTVLPFGFSEFDGRVVAFHDTFGCQPDERFYGFGEKFTDFDKRGQRLKMWNYAHDASSELAYKNVPFFVSTRGYGVFVDSVTPVEFDMARENQATWSMISPDSALEYYVIADPHPRGIVERYSSLVGLPTLPPKWAFGLWISSGFQADSTEKALDRARKLREHGIPADVAHLDCYWQPFGTWSSLQWDRDNFPDPEGLIQELKGLGFRVCLWINPYMPPGTAQFREGEEGGYFLRDPEGSTYVVPLWMEFHPPVAIVDFTNPVARAWFQDLLRPLLQMGVDVFKTDFGEGVPADAVAYNGMRGDRLHNLYPLLYNDAVADVTAEETGRQGLVWGRSTYAGGQRHAVQWSGDPNCTYSAMASTLRGGLSIAMCGHAFWSHDIGGFHHTPTDELFIRWAQFGLLSPMSRAHGMSSRLPWEYGEKACEIFRHYARLRYALLPYLYTYGAIAARSGSPIMRPMVFEFPDDPATHALDLQYMLGRELMVAPIYQSEGARAVYFPVGSWFDYWTGEVVEGPGYRKVEVGLETMPLYVRLDAVIPMIEPVEHTSEEPFVHVQFHGFVRDAAGFELVDLDGSTAVRVERSDQELNVSLSGVRRKVDVVVHALERLSATSRVTVNGIQLDRYPIGEDVVGVGWTVRDDGSVRLRAGEEWG